MCILDAGYEFGMARDGSCERGKGTKIMLMMALNVVGGVLFSWTQLHQRLVVSGHKLDVMLRSRILTLRGILKKFQIVKRANC